MQQAHPSSPFSANDSTFSISLVLSQTPLKIPGTVVVFIVVIAHLAVIPFIYREFKKNPQIRVQLPGIHVFPGTDQQSNPGPPDSIFSDAGSHEKRFTFQQVVTMTNNFQNQLGRGGFGVVYYGKMTDGKAVAVKRLSSGSRQGASEFQNEVDILLRVHHRNLVSLIGYCKEFQERILIYEYVQEGALDDHLHRLDNSANKYPLGWQTRIRIALDAAKGLKYLHSDCDPKIIHRDVKASNILLDEKFTAKVADFGISKSVAQPDVTHITTEVKGTRGYLDPEYANGLDRLTEKSDVYSFGIVLLELLTGARHILPTPSGFQTILQWARPYIVANNVNEILDKSLEVDYNLEALRAVALLALKCLEYKGSARPYMSEVLEQLELIAKIHLKPMAPVETMNLDTSLEGSPNSMGTQTVMRVPLIRNSKNDKSSTGQFW